MQGFDFNGGCANKEQRWGDFLFAFVFLSCYNEKNACMEDIMAFLELNYFSEELKSAVTVNVLLPEKEFPTTGCKTLYLLHGLSNNHSAWMRKTSIERYAEQRGLAVIMPNVGRSWYTDTANGARYFTFVTEELPAVCRKFFRQISHRPEDTFIAGLSMGGYGAIKATLRCPQAYGGCISLSGAFDIWSDYRLPMMDEWRGIFGFDLAHPSALAGTEHDIFALAKKNYEAGIPFPKLYMWCGKSDRPGLLDANRQFHSLLEQLGVVHTYVESEGDHSWKWWDLHIQSALDYLLDETNLVKKEIR